MKFPVQLALACFSAGALANVAPRDLSNFETCLTNVQDKVDILKSAVNAFHGNTLPVQNASDALVAEIHRSDVKLSGEVTLNLAETFQLNAVVIPFIADVKTLIDSLYAKRSEVISAGECALVRKNIDTINTNAGTLMGTVVSKCALEAISIAKEQEKRLLDLLDRCKQDYSTSNCP